MKETCELKVTARFDREAWIEDILSYIKRMELSRYVTISDPFADPIIKTIKALGGDNES